MAHFYLKKLSLIGLSPDLLFLGFTDQLISELGMGNGDQFFSSFPGGAAGEVDYAVFGGKEVSLAAGAGDDVAVKVRQDAGTECSVLGGVRGVHADKSLAAP